MRIALVCPSNLLFMPYVDNYTRILKGCNKDYDIILWDRFHIEDEKNPLIYRDAKIGHQRGFLDYHKYYKFVIKILNAADYDKVIVFGLQLAFFLKRVLIKEFKGNYIIDIRDYNKIVNYFNIGKIINASSFSVLSSPGFKQWLPESDKYVINHNTQIQSTKELAELKDCRNKERFTVAYIGSVRNYRTNVELISSLKKCDWIDIVFHGEGYINESIQEYLDLNGIENVTLTGRYNREDEENLYLSTDLVNILVSDESINNRTLLPNRLYNAAKYGKPILALDGTYLAEQIKKYNLGIVINSFDDVEYKIKEYMDNFDSKSFDTDRNRFLDAVMQENRQYRTKVEDFTANTEDC
ncbi:MAG TPA: hypothetical protein DIW17_19770 [Clostridiales bacterium]|nr:hypothetical protein [Clostridiales bacterium]